mmetsp:Transcript_62535/g.183340  ORF Transcript_62535/g.183340 Transcript_62535/m.183340 type:complete len:83 (+) Transcript_62535:241-489(+)
MDKLAEKYAGKVNFLLINMESTEKATAYAGQKGLTGACPHGAGKPPDSYGIKYIPHKTLIGKDGNIIKNYEGFKWEDIDSAL